MDMNAIKLQEGFGSFQAAREEGDMDLVALTREKLAGHVSPDILVDAFDQDPIVKEASIRQPHIQRFLLNRYWVRQLVVAPVGTMQIRACLVSDGTEEAWFRTFTESVLPFVLAHGLPKVLRG